MFRTFAFVIAIWLRTRILYAAFFPRIRVSYIRVGFHSEYSSSCEVFVDLSTKIIDTFVPSIPTFSYLTTLSIRSWNNVIVRETSAFSEILRLKRKSLHNDSLSPCEFSFSRDLSFEHCDHSLRSLLLTHRLNSSLSPSKNSANESAENSFYSLQDIFSLSGEAMNYVSEYEVR